MPFNCINPIHYEASSDKIKVCPDCGAFTAGEQARAAEKRVENIPETAFTFFRKVPGVAIGYGLLFLITGSFPAYLLYEYLVFPGILNHQVVLPLIVLGFIICFFTARAGYQAAKFRIGVHPRAIIRNRVRIPLENIRAFSTETFKSRYGGTSTALYLHFRNSGIKGTIRIPRTISGFKEFTVELMKLFPETDENTKVRTGIFCPYCGGEFDQESADNDGTCSFCAGDLNRAIENLSNKCSVLRTGNRAGFYVVLILCLGVMSAIVFGYRLLIESLGIIGYIILLIILSFFLLLCVAAAWGYSNKEDMITYYLDFLSMVYEQKKSEPDD